MCYPTFNDEVFEAYESITYHSPNRLHSIDCKEAWRNVGVGGGDENVLKLDRSIKLTDAQYYRFIKALTHTLTMNKLSDMKIISQ